MRIAYGLETGSIEDPVQLVLVDVPDGLDADGIEAYLRDAEPFPFQPLIGLDDVLEALALVLDAEGYSGLTGQISADIVQQLFLRSYIL